LSQDKILKRQETRSSILNFLEQMDIDLKNKIKTGEIDENNDDEIQN